MSRICPKCGKEMSDTAKFCNQCGYRFEERQLFCLWCGAKVESGDRFCPECGRSLSQGGPGPQQNAGWQNAGQQNTGQAGGGFTKDEVISMSKSGVGKFVDAINDMTGMDMDVNENENTDFGEDDYSKASESQINAALQDVE